jgi:hypothetical protein
MECGKKFTNAAPSGLFKRLLTLLPGACAPGYKTSALRALYVGAAVQLLAQHNDQKIQSGRSGTQPQPISSGSPAVHYSEFDFPSEF